jgi:hypothetical protein
LSWTSSNHLSCPTFWGPSGFYVCIHLAINYLKFIIILLFFFFFSRRLSYILQELRRRYSSQSRQHWQDYEWVAHVGHGLESTHWLWQGCQDC